LRFPVQKHKILCTRPPTTGQTTSKAKAKAESRACNAAYALHITAVCEFALTHFSVTQNNHLQNHAVLTAGEGSGFGVLNERLALGNCVITWRKNTKNPLEIEDFIRIATLKKIFKNKSHVLKYLVIISTSLKQVNLHN